MLVPNPISREDLSSIQTPQPVGRHYPIPHQTFVSEVFNSLQSHNIKVESEEHGIDKEGNRYFGLLTISPDSTEHKDTRIMLGLRNSHDKSFSAGLVIGAQVMVCSNLSFSGEVRIARKHTKYITNSLPSLVTSAVGKIGDARQIQAKRIQSYKEASILDSDANHLIITALDNGVIGTNSIKKVLSSYRNPDYESFQDRTIWSLFNSFTEHMKRHKDLNEISKRTQILHGILDSSLGIQFDSIETPYEKVS